MNEVKSPQGYQSNDLVIPNIGVFPQSVTNAAAAGMGMVVQAPKRGGKKQYI